MNDLRIDAWSFCSRIRRVPKHWKSNRRNQGVPGICENVSGTGKKITAQLRLRNLVCTYVFMAWIRCMRKILHSTLHVCKQMREVFTFAWLFGISEVASLIVAVNRCILARIHPCRQKLILVYKTARCEVVSTTITVAAAAATTVANHHYCCYHHFCRRRRRRRRHR